MRIEFREAGNVLVAVPLEERLDAANYEALTQQIVPKLEEGRAVAIDLGHVEYISSAGLGALLLCTQTAESGGTRFALCGLSDKIRNLLTAMRLDEALTIFDDVQQAARSLCGEGGPGASDRE